MLLPDWFYSAKINVPAPAEIVWRVVANPKSWTEINSLCKSVTRESSSSVVQVGEAFVVEEKLLEGDGLEITDWEVCAVESQTSIHYRGRKRENPNNTCDIYLTLSPRKDGRKGVVVKGCMKPSSMWPGILLLVFLRTEGLIFKDTFLRGVRRVAKSRARGIE